MDPNPYESPRTVSGTQCAPPTNFKSVWTLFVKSFAIALGIQFLAWILAFADRSIREVYFTFYLPVFYIFPGPHYPRYGLGFYIFVVPVVGSLLYSTVAGLLTILVRKPKVKPQNRIAG